MVILNSNKGINNYNLNILILKNELKHKKRYKFVQNLLKCI